MGVQGAAGVRIECAVTSAAYGRWPAIDPGRSLKIGRRAGIMKLMAAEEQLVHVTLSGDINGEYIVKDEGLDGEITLVPDTSLAAVRQRLGTEPMNAEEFEQHFGDLPTDDEG
jgi:hypothetical protein